ncbi:macrophage mannose receptor 1-like [Tachysurus ichikawai]
MKSLIFICHLLVLYGTAVSLIREYVYFPQLMSWNAAQSYCRQQYGDLATITTEEENQRAVSIWQYYVSWIGLTRTGTWQWSDGEELNFTKWYTGQPDYKPPGKSCAALNSQGWRNYDCDNNFAFICSRSFTLVKEKKTWEEALHHCRTYYSNLAFVDSQTLLDLLKTETEQAQTATVWTGLCFLDGNWSWVNGAPLGRLASLPPCPIKPYRCGAYNFSTYIWENRDCNEELNFLCYD